MIRIAGIDADDVEENDDSITIKTEAQPLVYIDGAAATVGGEAGAWVVTKPAITADTAISIVKATTIPAVGHKWYENPTLMGKVTVAYGKDGCGGWNGAKDLAGDYIAAAFGYSGLSAVVTKISDLVAGNGGEVDPIAVFPASEIGGSLRGAGISTALGVVVFGSAGTHEITVISLDGATTNKITTSNGVIPDSFWFSDDGQFLYTSGYEVSSDATITEGDARKTVFKYEIKDNLIGDGEKLVVAETYTVGQRVRGMTKFGNVILARTDDGYYAIDLSATEPAFAKVGAGNKYDDVVIAGSHFYHVDKGTGILSIYNLNAAGTWYEGDAIMTINVKNVLGCRVSDTGNNFFVTPDEETLVFCETVEQTPQVVKAFQWTQPPGFMIRIAGIDAADVEEGTDSITIKTEAQPLVYIDGAAATVAGEAGAWTVTKPAITADTAVSIVAATTIPTTGHAWYENPTLMGYTTANSADTDGCAGWNGGFDLAGDYIAAAYGYSSQGMILTKISDLVNGEGGEVDPIRVVQAAEIGGSLRGSGVSTALGVTISGSAGKGQITVISLDGATTNLVTTSNGVVPDSYWFTDDGKFLYANGYEVTAAATLTEGEARQRVFKYEIVDNLIGDGEKLVLVETYLVGQRVRGMTKFGDVIIARTDGGYYAIDLAATEPTFAKVGDGSKYDDVVIAGDHLYYLSLSAKTIAVYNLNAAGTWYEGDAIATINLASIGLGASGSGDNFFVTANEETMVFSFRNASGKLNTVKAFQWTLPTYDITFAVTLNGTLETSVTNDIAAGTTVTVTATPATGYECTQITTNGAAITGTSFDMPADDVEIGATFALQQFTVAAITVENATAVATNTATETGLDLPATVDYNTAIAVTVTPDTGYEYATTPAGWTKNENGSITTNATVTANLAITVEAPTAAAAPWPVIPEFPADADDEVKGKYADWAKTYGVTDPAGNSDAFLMNVDPTGDVPELEIKGIEVEGTTATITVGTDTTDFDLGKVNGVLYVESTDELAGEWTIEQYDLPTGEVGQTATFTVTAGKFMRAKVGFKDPTK